jgi:hypothetical protein
MPKPTIELKEEEKAAPSSPLLRKFAEEKESWIESVKQGSPPTRRAQLTRSQELQLSDEILKRSEEQRQKDSMSV